ncbi:MAG: YidC/Oxa1 family membrane protein insertase [Acidaminococcaceae bacterium]|nr:YidC/Oxa1 family membrane protein insertase [Acidaminococcaceae bacterium]
MDFIANLISQVVQTLYHFLGSLGMPNYGLAIVLMTIIIKIILFPLTKKQIESTKAMMAIQPKMKEIQEKYKYDKVRLNQELAKLYKEQNVNPMAGCLPLLIQMPILFGIYYAIRDFHYEGPANFLWMENIANPDPMYILPVLSAVTTYIQTKQTMPKKNPGDKPQEGIMGMMQGQMMQYFMPLFIGYISLSFPAGLVLYWIVMNIMQIAQQAYINGKMDK